MHNSKLYSILEHFNKYEQNRCRKYIQSPYFNKNETLVLIFEALIKDINRGKKKDITKEAFWKKISKQAYDDVRFRKYLSELLKLIEGFISQQVYESNPLYQATFLIDAVGDKKLEKLYNSTMRSARRLSEQQNNRSASHFYHQYRIERSYYDLTEFERNRTDRQNSEEIAENLDCFYLAEKLRIYCGVLSQQNITPYTYDLKFMEEIIRHIESNDYNHIPPIALYYQIYLTHIEPDNEAHYFKLKELLDMYGLQFPINQAKDELYMSAQNYCIRKINQGNQQFLKELFILYQDLLKREIIFADGELSPWYFRNIVVIGLRLGEFKWTESFIHNYNEKLPEELRENAVSFNLASLYFYRKDYNNVIQLLQTVEYDDFTYNLNSKAMLLATYYETDEIEPLYSLLESFRTYLNRHKNTIQENRRASFLNLIRFTKKLSKITYGEEKAIQKLKEEIKTNPNVASIGWLKEKISELE